MGRTAAKEGVPEAKDRIFAAAVSLFAEKGYDGAAIAEIADRAGVNRGLPFYYWESKRALYGAVVDAGLGGFTRMVEETVAQPGSAAVRLRAFVQGHLSLLWHRAELMRVVDRCLMDGHVEELGLTAKFGGTVAHLENLFREGAASGELRCEDPAFGARLLLGPGFIFSMWRLFEGSRFTEEELAAKISDQLLHGFGVAPEETVDDRT
jgi:TetR/AcrR family transcriptional regulator